MMKLNWGCGPHRAPAPWHNIDVVRLGDIQPDEVVEARLPLPFEEGSCERIYLGHMLEHWPWGGVKALLEEARRLLAPEGELMVVGPDVYRTLRLWQKRHAQAPWEQVVAALEGMGSYQPDGDSWDQARHHWNCHEERVVAALESAGFAAEPVEVGADTLAGWPVVSFTPTQCAVRATLRK